MTPLYEPFPFGISRARSVWDRMLKRFGDLALLRQPGRPDRYVSYMQAQFTAMERMGGISNPADRKALLSVYDPATGEPLDPEPSERDVLVTLVLNDDGSPVNGKPQEDELLKIVAPPARVGPSRKELYWRLQVRA
jgi:hypothetical protein